jgi:hypothetical protein
MICLRNIHCRLNVLRFFVLLLDHDTRLDFTCSDFCSDSFDFLDTVCFSLDICCNFDCSDSSSYSSDILDYFDCLDILALISSKFELAALNQSSVTFEM